MIKELKDYLIVKKSGLFDPAYYLVNNPDVRRADIDPLWHYVNFGWKEGRNPSASFSVNYYLNKYSDVNAANINPLIHYIRYGRREQRNSTDKISYDNPSSENIGNKKAITSYKIFVKIKEIGLINTIKRAIDIYKYEGRVSFLRNISKKVNSLDKNPFNNNYHNPILGNHINFLSIAETAQFNMISTHSEIDIVICVHNALEDFRNCISSIRKNTTPPYRLVIVDDDSNEETKNYIAEIYSLDNTIRLITNTKNLGYTKSANKGLQESHTNYVVLMNSDVIVTSRWLENMESVFLLNEKVGIVGPMSNTASWQSIPKLLEGSDWARNPLPAGVSIDGYGNALSKFTKPVFPAVPLINGFCMMIRKEVFSEIGFFDDDAFPIGYGEEDDFILRARKAGWEARWADNTYIFHAQSRSFTDFKRLKLSKDSMAKLKTKHGETIITDSCQYLTDSLIFKGIREHSKYVAEREKIIELGRRKFNQKRLLFVLPIAAAGGGANVVIDEALSMIEMGVDVRIFNLTPNKRGTMEGYPNLQVPMSFGEIGDLKNLIPLYDAVIATANISVEWIMRNIHGKTIFGYYIQGFEPLCYDPNSNSYNIALTSYTLSPRIIRFTKTEWTRRQVLINTGMDSNIIGISVNTDLFRKIKDQNRSKIRVAGMIRPSTDYRAPKLTMEVFREISNKYRDSVEIWIYGCDTNDQDFYKLPVDFSWNSLGVLTQKQVVSFFNEIDIFCDFSSHQAMGLSVLEAMCCGCSVVVPENGGTVEYIQNEINGIIVDTSSKETCVDNLARLIENPSLVEKLKQNAISTANKFYVENAAINILSTLFPSV
jgi:GT2 family glycosyltransferase